MPVRRNADGGSMKRKSTPIDEALAEAVEERLDRALAAGPKPRRTKTKQALFSKISGRVQEMRAKGFTLEEIARLISEGGLTCSSAMVSSYMSRNKLGSVGGTTGKTTCQKAKQKKAKSASPASERISSREEQSSPKHQQQDERSSNVVLDVTMAAQENSPKQDRAINAEQILPSSQRTQAVTSSSSPQPSQHRNSNWMQDYS